MQIKRTTTLTMLIVSAVALLAACGEVSGTPGTTPRYIAGTFKGTKTEKSVTFTTGGKFDVYMNTADLKAGVAGEQGTYHVEGTDIVFVRANGTEFEEVGKLSADEKSFTWDEFPGETFVRQ